MTEHERVTYENWLSQPHLIDCLFDRYFQARRRRTAWGKLYYLGCRGLRDR